MKKVKIKAVDNNTQASGNVFHSVLVSISTLFLSSFVSLNWALLYFCEPSSGCATLEEPFLEEGCPLVSNVE